MRLVTISDTHQMHEKVILPEGDVLIHAGDMSHQGGKQATIAFNEWLGRHKYKHIIFVPGNHDRNFEQWVNLAISMVPNAITLIDRPFRIGELKVWGSPVQPCFGNWAFNRNPEQIKAHWDLIPNDTDILITHGPPQGVLDTTHKGGEHLGCPSLMQAVDRVRPLLHVFGHIHGGFGHAFHDNTLFINAAQADESYRITRKPVVVDYLQGRFQVVEKELTV